MWSRLSLLIHSDPHSCAFSACPSGLLLDVAVEAVGELGVRTQQFDCRVLELQLLSRVSRDRDVHVTVQRELRERTAIADTHEEHVAVSKGFSVLDVCEPSLRQFVTRKGASCKQDGGAGGNAHQRSGLYGAAFPVLCDRHANYYTKDLCFCQYIHCDERRNMV